MVSSGVVHPDPRVLVKERISFIGYMLPLRTYTRGKPQNLLSLGTLFVQNVKEEVARRVLYEHVLPVAAVVCDPLSALWVR